jgi:hypothetical protein
LFDLHYLSQTNFVYMRLFSSPLFFLLPFFLFACRPAQRHVASPGIDLGQVGKLVQEQVLREAQWALQQQPITVTASFSPRSAGGKHDFFSEGDYWWPNPKHPDSPYVQRDGMTNPDNFVDHRRAMVQLSSIMGALLSAYRLTKETRYANHALLHARAWFIDPSTRMNPSLLYAQAVKGRFTGRGIGIIDTIHLLEVVQALLVLEQDKLIEKSELLLFRNWFAAYLKWLTTHPYGITEMNGLNNHGTCWTMQVAQFATFTQNDSLLRACRSRFKNVHLPDQMALDGSFPKELARTKPYGYALFNLDAMSMLCQILSTKQDNLWLFALPDGRSIKKGITFMYPFVADKTTWPFKQDVMYWNNWPVAHPFLLFGALAFNEKKLFQTWASLPRAHSVEEVIRNLPVRYPLIWL